MQQVRIDFDNPGLPQSLGVVEGESQSRIFQAALYKSGAAYTAPAGAVYSIMYRGFGPQNQGWYDTIEDGAGKRAACTVSGNVVTCELARQALRVPGHLTVVLCVSDAKGYMLKSWPIMADVRNDGYEDTGEIEMYFNLSGLAGNYLTQLEKAMADAEATKNNLISTSAQVQKDIDAKAAETLKTIPESYTELDGSVKQIDVWLTGLGGINVTSYRLSNDTSDDLMFNRAFNELTSKIISTNDYSGNYTLLIPGGTYTFKTPVRLSPLITYITTGPVIINSYANACFTSVSDNIPDHFNTGDKIDWMKKVWLNFNNCTIINKGISTATGISIGNTTYENGYKNVLAYYAIQGINITGFGEAFHFYPVNAFLFTLKDCIIENNIFGIVFGSSTQPGNYGENICINHCIFGHNKVGCQSRANGWLLNFNQCSFDFNRIGFYATDAGIFKFEECHFENNNETQNGTGAYGPIITTNNTFCAIIADKCTVLEHENPSVLFTNTAPGTLSLSNITFVTSFTTILTKPLFYQCEHATNASACNSYSYNYTLPVNKFDSLIKGDFADVVNSSDIQTFGITTDNYNSGFINKFDMSYNTDLTRRYLKITCTPTSNHGKNAIPYVKFQKFTINKATLLANAIYKLNNNTANVIIAIKYYNANDVEISTDQFKSTTTANEYVTNAPAPARFIPPANASTASIEIQFHMPTSGVENVSCELYYLWCK